MAKKNIWDDLNDLFNTDMSPSPGGSVTKRPGDFGYKTVFPWGDRKPADAAKSVAAAKAAKGNPGAGSVKPPAPKVVIKPAPNVSGSKKAFMPRKGK